MSGKASSGLSVAQVIGGALASVSAALVASKFGVAGTIIGAAMTSITVTIGSVLYRRSIEGAHERVRNRYRRSQEEGRTEEDGRTESEHPARPRRRLAWGAIASGTVLIFVVAMGGLTAFETIARTSAARLMGQSSSDARTTVGAVLQNVATESSGQESPSPEPDHMAAPGVATPTASPVDVEASPTPMPAGKPDPDAGKPTAPEPATLPSGSPDVGDPAPTEPEAPVATPVMPRTEPVG